jgi:2,3-dihydroxybenzoate decarboxylase/5-carboxyvanillate decarboxylase
MGSTAVLAGAVTAPGELRAAAPAPRLRRIATEEAFMMPEMYEAMKAMPREAMANYDLRFMYRMAHAAPGDDERRRLDSLLDIEHRRLEIMDEFGVDMHVLSLTSPGVQEFEPEEAGRVARATNDRLADIIQRHPLRFAGLAAFAPQDPKSAAQEMIRAREQLGLNGFIVNSHTFDEYLDEEKFWPILEAAEGTGGAIYIHPRAPGASSAAPMRNYGMEGGFWGYGAETGLHAVRLILSGVFDRFPKLTIVLGHMGEGLPWWLPRLDDRTRAANRLGTADGQLRMLPSEYFKRNFLITNSLFRDALALRYSIDRLGPENVMWSIDYPYGPTAEAVTFMDTVDISDVERALIYHRNAERVFHIPPVSTG